MESIGKVIRDTIASGAHANSREVAVAVTEIIADHEYPDSWIEQLVAWRVPSEVPSAYKRQPVVQNPSVKIQDRRDASEARLNELVNVPGAGFVKRRHISPENCDAIRDEHLRLAESNRVEADRWDFLGRAMRKHGVKEYQQLPLDEQI